jgi:nicotinate-nucleotide adenylyltransferase
MGKNCDRGPSPSPIPHSPSPQPVGLLGGTFDPIHFGHLRLAEELAEALAIPQVRVIPAGIPPHRGRPGAAPEARRDMAARAITGNPRFVLDERELRKAGPCYTVDTLAELRREAGEATPLVLFLGADAFMGLTKWHQWQRLFDLAHLAVAHRPGYAHSAVGDAMPEVLRAELSRRRGDAPEDLQRAAAGRIYPAVISRIRALVKAGASIRYLVPEAVLDYISTHQLYR